MSEKDWLLAARVVFKREPERFIHSFPDHVSHHNWLACKVVSVGAGDPIGDGDGDGANEDIYDDDDDDSDENVAVEQSESIPKTKKENRKRTRKKKDIYELKQIPWLSKLLEDEVALENADKGTPCNPEFATTPAASSSASASTSGDLGMVEEPRKSHRLGGIANELVLEAFGPKDDPKFQDELETNEESILNEILEESGIREMGEREEKLLNSACEQFSKLSEAKASKSPLLEENLARDIAKNVESGMDPEEAAEEAMLNNESLLGNETISPKDLDDTGLDQLETADEKTKHDATRKSIAMRREAFIVWVEECICSFQALIKKTAEDKRPVGDNGELSLVLGDISGASASKDSEDVLPKESNRGDYGGLAIFWVHWKFAGDLGRPASLDKDNRVKCIVATGSLKEPRNYKDVQIIVPSVGVKMERVRGFKGQLRPKIPDQIMRLHDMYQTALVSKDADSLDKGPDKSLNPLERYVSLTEGLSPCFFCNSATTKQVCDPDGCADPFADRVQICPFCLLPGHSSCRDELVVHVRNNEVISFPENVDVESVDLPNIFDSDTPKPSCRKRAEFVNEANAQEAIM